MKEALKKHLQLDGGDLLHDISRLVVEYPEEGLIREAGHFLVDGVDVLNGIAGRKLVLWLWGARWEVAEGSGPGRPEGSGFR